MRNARLFGASLGLALLSLFLMTGGSAQAAQEAKIYGVTSWNAGCSGSARPKWDDMADDWYDEVTDKGFSFLGFCFGGHCGDAMSRDGRQVNGNIVNSKFADLNVVSWGRDSNELDDADVALLFWHGARKNGTNYKGSLRVDESGDGDCKLRRSEMDVGDRDLEFLHFSSCYSMNDTMWSRWWQAFDGAHQIDGFHGLMWIGGSLVSDYGDFGNQAFHTTIADAWLDNMYYEDTFNGGSDDQCPVAYAVGANGADTWSRIGSERYNNVKSDPRTIGYWGVVFIAGCDPAGEDTINQ